MIKKTNNLKGGNQVIFLFNTDLWSNKKIGINYAHPVTGYVLS